MVFLLLFIFKSMDTKYSTNVVVDFHSYTLKKLNPTIMSLHCLLFFFLIFIFGCSGSSLPCGHFLQLQCKGFSLQRLLLLWTKSSKACGFSSCGCWTLEHRLNSCGLQNSCSLACVTFLDQEQNQCSLHWQADSLPLSHQGGSSHISIVI